MCIAAASITPSVHGNTPPTSLASQILQISPSVPMSVQYMCTNVRNSQYYELLLCDVQYVPHMQQSGSKVRRQACMITVIMCDRKYLMEVANSRD